MTDSSENVHRHYSLADLESRILGALEQAGKDLHTLTIADIASFDEFHFGGLVETNALAELAQLKPGTRVLDVGCGVGGPARRLAVDFACEVMGIDIIDDFCRAATMLTKRVGLADKVSFRRASALAMPFEDASFDVVWLQHVTMNIADKARLFAEIHRVLRPGGRLAFHEVMAGPGATMRFPVFWAGSPDLSFLESPEHFHAMLNDAGLSQRHWQDISTRAESLTRKRHEAAGEKPSPLGLGVIVSHDVAEKIDNSLFNLEQKNIVVVQGVWEK